MLSHRMHEMMGRHGWTPRTLADWLGCTQCMIFAWVHGEAETTVSYLWTVAIRTGYTMDQLVSDEPLGDRVNTPDETALAPARKSPHHSSGAGPVTAFGVSLAVALETRGWSMRELGRRTGLGSSSISEWVRETIDPSLGNAEIVAKSLGLNLHQMCEGSSAGH